MPFRDFYLWDPNAFNNSFLVGANIFIDWSVAWWNDPNYQGMWERSMDSTLVRLYRDGSLYHTQSYGPGSWCAFTMYNMPAGDYSISLQVTKNGEDSGEVTIGGFTVAVNPPLEISTTYTMINPGLTKPIYFGQFDSSWQNIDSVSIENYIKYADGSFSGTSECDIQVGQSFPHGSTIYFRSKAVKNGIVTYGGWKSFTDPNGGA